MKKLLVIFLISVACILPVRAFAKSYYAGHETKNFKETLADEEIKIENADYKETSDQATIYLFRGHGCGYCRNFLTFLNSISKEYGKKFKVVSFEVWNDKNNNDLMKKVSEFTGEEAGGVPYIVIGEKVFGGYINSWNDQIKDAINTLYESKDKYDVFEEMVAAERKAKWEKMLTSGVLPIVNIVLVIGFGTAILVIQNKNRKLILNSIKRNNNVVSHEKEESKPVNNKFAKKGKK